MAITNPEASSETPVLDAPRILSVTIGGERFSARLRADLAPRSCAWLVDQAPLRLPLVHARWSGEACWASLGPRDLGLPCEQATAHPAPGDMLLYGGGVSEAEILIAYGPTAFRSKAGPLAGNLVVTFIGGGDRLAAIGRRILWEGAQILEIDTAPSTAAATEP